MNCVKSFDITNKQNPTKVLCRLCTDLLPCCTQFISAMEFPACVTFQKRVKFSMA